MEDRTIISLYWARDEQAIRQTAIKYSGYCGSIAGNILQNEQDTPAAVIIKEAVDMAGRYSTEKSGAFVNGVLSAYMKDHEGETV